MKLSFNSSRINLQRDYQISVGHQSVYYALYYIVKLLVSPLPHASRTNFGAESCFSIVAWLASRRRVSRRRCSWWFFYAGFQVGVAGVYKVPLGKDRTCSAVLHTGTTGSHGERRL